VKGIAARPVALGNLERSDRPGGIEQLEIAIDQKVDLAWHGLKRRIYVIHAKA